ncbi:YadA-like family protein [Kluyvera sp. 142359]|uniref:YadA-like family protein n=1 Tax=Kluyvera sp. 142359 TaxID=3375726 RepID=UPI0037719FCE
MNKIYRLVWNPSLRIWVAVSEFAKAKGKGKTSRRSVAAAGLIGALAIMPLQNANAYYIDGSSTNNGDDDSVAIGTNAYTGMTGVIQTGTISTGNTSIDDKPLSNVAIGESASAISGGIAMGDHATVAALTGATDTADAGIAIGSYATSRGQGATAIGAASLAVGTNALALGTGSEADNVGDIAIGNAAHASVVSDIGVSGTEYNIAIGNKSQASGGQTVALGNGTKATGKQSVAIGSASSATSEQSISIGTSSSATANQSTALGYNARANASGSTAIGISAETKGDNAFALGNGSQAQSADSIAFGNNAISSAAKSVALGTDSKSSGINSLALGTNANAVANNSVALGSNSVANTAVGTASYEINGTTYNFAGIDPFATVSVGKTGNERTITNVGAGRISATSTDAINGSQLYATDEAIDALADQAVKYDTNTDGSINYNSVTLGGDTYNSATQSGGTTITNVARGVDDSDAVNMSQLNETNADVDDINTVITDIAGDTSATYTDANGTGIRYVRTNEEGLTEADSYATGQGSTAVGYNATSAGVNSLALGNGAQANNDGDIALGADSTTEAAVGTSSVTINGTEYAFAGTSPTSTVSIGSAGNERTITNVAAGQLSETSTDAVNGSQLNATNQALEDISVDVSGLDDIAVKYDTNTDGSINYNSVTLGGDTYNSATQSGGTTITNVARGVDDSDAVNMSQLNETNADVTDINTVITDIAGDTSATYTDANGTGIRYVRTNEEGLTEADSYATGQGSTAVGYNATSAGVNSLALGNGAQANNDGDIALGADSTTEAAVGTSGVTIRGTDYTFAGTSPTSTVSVGSAGNERTITNVAAGQLSETSTDAINGSQLYATNQALENLDLSIGTLDGAAVKYDTNADGSVNYNSITLGGDEYDSDTKTGGTTITNVAWGVNDSDAVNVQQLNAATSSIYNSGSKYFHANSEKADSAANGTDSVAVGPNAQANGESSIAMGNDAVATGTSSTAIGQDALSVGNDSVAMGTGAVASNDGDVALGAGSTTGEAVATTGTTIRGQDYTFAGTTPTSTVSVGSEGNERTITNVAAGQISATSTDAINGSQLYATNQALENLTINIDTLDNTGVKYDVNEDGSINYGKITVGGETYDESTHTGGTIISNVADGVNASDAVNKSQLDTVNQSVTNIAEGTDGMFQVNNTSNLSKPSVTGNDAVAGGAGSVASATNSTAIGTSATASHENSVALGANSVTDRENSVSVGYSGGERQITNVAAGTADTDAVNVSQLKQTYQYTNNKFNDLKNMIDDQDDKLSAGIAGAMAMASLPQPYSAGASMFSMGAGGYGGESALAFGVSTVSDNGKWVTKMSGTTNSQGDIGAAVGIGYQW